MKIKNQLVELYVDRKLQEIVRNLSPDDLVALAAEHQRAADQFRRYADALIRFDNEKIIEKRNPDSWLPPKRQNLN